MPAHHRARLLLAALTALAALALAGCHNGEGLRDEGPSHSLEQPCTGRTQPSFCATSVAQ
ncbi:MULTISPECIES: hypothetical protein [unclassified Streptomyces]|uniref:hypothetical protein n=1 Tax=unclassified Streptomyces TaxID=2593676 RepID=UPI001F05017B|nr:MULTISPECIES: hypothetical protein [unclassified Streptomyces]MCH0563129.1 hypothetical protein [Streptomyces sp. MUM 2J]MCH0568558.1 hypothetical protein [Streptomyces sp. MUM 136J]